jgi:hypothetical protein
MTASSESKPKQPEELPKFPTVKEMETSNEEVVLRWIRQRKPNLLKDNNLKKFIEAEITGSAFLLANFEFFKGCELSRGVSLVLNDLVDEVKKGKFIPRT